MTNKASDRKTLEAFLAMDGTDTRDPVLQYDAWLLLVVLIPNLLQSGRLSYRCAYSRRASAGLDKRVVQAVVRKRLSASFMNRLDWIFVELIVTESPCSANPASYSKSFVILESS